MTDDIFKYVDFDRTFRELNYDPRQSSAMGRKPSFCFCPICEQQKAKPIAYRDLGKHQPCASCAAKKRMALRLKVKLDSIENREDVSPFVDIEKTIALFGYDPRNLNPMSSSKVIGKCISCGTEKKKPIPMSGARKKCRNCAEKEKPNKFMAEYENRTLENFEFDENKYKHVNIEKTIQSFGYDARLLGERSSRKVYSNCPDCKIESLRILSATIKHPLCRQCGQARKSFKKKNNKVEIGNVLVEKTIDIFGYDPNTLKKHSLRPVICLCPSCLQERELPFSDARRTKHCKACNSGENAFLYGKTPKHNPNGAWYLTKSGERVWMRSSWEIKYAEYLDEQGIIWEYENKAFPVTFSYEGEERKSTYRPDFSINGEWIEIKGWWRDDAKEKFEAFKDQYPDEKITLLMKSELLALGIDVN